MHDVHDAFQPYDPLIEDRPPATDEPGPRRTPRTLAIVAVLVLTASASFFVGTRMAPSPPATQAPTPVAAAPADPVDPSMEPVAEVARVLLPSTVHIRAGNGAGSGVIYDPDGLILTAAHVVAGRSEVGVRLADGTRLDGVVLGTDQTRDVAVVRVGATGLPAAQLAVGVPLQVGQLAVAIGSPFGLEDTVTSGVVSAVGRSLPTPTGIMEVLQTDAPINPGNSGGPLADRLGRVIGINVATRAQGSGVSFAVPIDVAMQSAERLARGEPAPPVAFLGVSGTDASTGPAGALIVDVEAGSPAAQAGVLDGDLIVRIDDTVVRGMVDLAAAIRSRSPGDAVTLTIVRDGDEIEVEATLGQRS